MIRLVARVAVLLLCMSPPAFGQPAPTPEEVQQAQARWTEGKAFFDAGNYESARIAFKQAYTVFPHVAFLQNLGEAELRCGRQVEAARHLSQFIRNATAGSTAQREAAKKSLKKASESLGSLVVETNTDDAEVRVDDDVIGRSPLGSMPWYVEPGSHLVTARREGYLDGTERVDVVAGPPKSVFVKLQRVVGAPDEVKTDAAGTSDPRPAVPSSSIESTVATPSDAKRGASLPPRTIVLAGGAVLAVSALALAGYFQTKVAGDDDDATAARRKLEGLGGFTTGTCLVPASAAAKDACDSLAVSTSHLDSHTRTRNALLLTGGIFGVATVATFFLWPNRPSRSVAIVPEASPSRAGIVLTGRF